MAASQRWGSDLASALSTFYGFDLQANTGITVTPAGSATQYLYTAFGEKLRGGSVGFQFGGQVGYQMPEGLDPGLYVRARYLDTALGRWASRDPIGFAGGIDLYSYVGNHPVGFSDASGLSKWLGVSLSLPDPAEDPEGWVREAYRQGLFGPVDKFGNLAADAYGTVNAGAGAAQAINQRRWLDLLIALVPLSGLVGLIARGGRAARSRTGRSLMTRATYDAWQFLSAVGGSRPIYYYPSFRRAKRALPRAPRGWAWHHIVEQCEQGRFGPALIHNTENLVLVPASVNDALNRLYQRRGMRPWLAQQSYEFQYRFGMEWLHYYMWQHHMGVLP